MVYLMAKLYYRKWRVLCWNVRGLNSDARQRAVRAKIEESDCAIVCLQETKCDYFDQRLLRKFCPKRFDNFAYAPSVGASGGILVLWNSAIFSGSLVEVQRFGISIQFTSTHNSEIWTLTTVYGPCRGADREQFVSWLYNLNIPPLSNHLLLGDFNFIRSQDNRNKPGGNINDMFIFNDIIGHLGLLELPIKGRSYTWSNMQQEPLLEQLDWFFTSPNWSSSYPNTLVLPLSKPESDHTPCVVNIDTHIPKAKIFRFENYWVDMPGFLDCVKESWEKPSHKKSSVAVLVDKLKTLRHDLKKWQKGLSKLKLLIQKCNQVIFILDSFEDKRPLTTVEFNFRKIVKLHLEELLLAECNYWRKRCTVRWIKLGEDNTKFFHAMATERFRRNTIASLKREDGSEITDHTEMAGMLWASYKGRMGSTEGIEMQFDLDNIITKVDGLEVLSRPFEKKEMDDIIKYMPADKAPGPDGFNGLFLKKCWHIIQKEFYALAQDFHDRKIGLQNINSSFITLIPKKGSPENVNDYRPISLTSVCLKFLTKLAANRFQDHILKCIHKNQYGFIRTRTIQDCVAWVYEYIYLCQLSKQPILIIKLDFAKAFDTIEHEAILKILEHKGFDKLWIHWMREVLSSGTSSILLNGVPGKQFVCKRGVRQGDPLSPLLYVSGGDLLQSVINEALQQGILKFPIITNETDFPVVQYADDTILLISAEMDQVVALKEILHKFGLSTGLKVNFQKSLIIPLNVDPVEVAALAAVLDCQVGSLPFPYLGLPLGTTKPCIKDLLPLVNSLDRRLTATSIFLSQGARLQLINSALSSMPLHFLLSLNLPIGLTEQLDRILRQCLWRDKDEPKPSLAAWEMVCKPKAKGGLGIVNFQKKNDALLMKHLDKFYNKAQIPWVQLIWGSYYVDSIPDVAKPCGSFWWRDIVKLQDKYKQVAVISLGTGSTFRFWLDKWNFLGSAEPLANRFTRLFSYVLNPDMLAAEVFSTTDFYSLFYRPLSAQAYDELVLIQQGMVDHPISDTCDIWEYKWGPKYASSAYYAHLHEHLVVPAVYKWIWSSACAMKLKVFAWLLLSDRLNTRDMLIRRNWKVTDDKHCVLCPGRIYEDRIHLFFTCNFSQRVWNYLQITWHMGDDIQPIVAAAKRDFGKPFFMEVMILACWHIWKQRNGKIFQHERPTFARWRSNFVHDVTLLQYRIKRKHKAALLTWISSLL